MIKNKKRQLGQHFLQSYHVEKKIIQHLNIQDDDILLEIGPGKGTITKHLLFACSKRLVVIEKDPKLLSFLHESHSWQASLENNSSKIESYEQDILSCNFDDYFSEEETIKIVSNTPYSISKRIIKTIIEKIKKWDLAVLMVQKEVGDSIIDHSTAFGGLVSVYCDVKRVCAVSKKHFKPSPKVDSCVIKLTPKNEREFKMESLYGKEFEQIYSSRNKKLKNNLFVRNLTNSVEILEKRASQLTSEQLYSLIYKYYTSCFPK